MGQKGMSPGRRGDFGEDGDYAVFLENLRECGHSFVFEMLNEEDGSLIRINYEDEDNVTPQIQEDKPIEDMKSTLEKMGETDRDKTGGEELEENATESLAEDSMHDREDHGYEYFLKHAARSCHGNMTLKVGNGNSVEYCEEKAQDHEQGSSLHGHYICTSPYAKGQLVDVFLSSMTQRKDLTDAPDFHFHELMQENRNMGFDQLEHDEEKARHLQVGGEYKKRLADVLSKPFDLAEYKDLYNAARTHKLVQKERNLRSGTKAYDTNCIAPSYLNRFPDFAERIGTAGFDPERCLRLLRGFFFWLKNLCHQGAFKPWLPKDSENGEKWFALDD